MLEPTAAELAAATRRMVEQAPAERLRLAREDPDGEAEAVVDLRNRRSPDFEAAIQAGVDEAMERLPSAYDLIESGDWVRTLADVPDDPPGDLLDGMLEPDGPTMACAAPGTGKGITGAWLACEAQRAGRLPVIYDAERRPREWARRVAGLGGDRSRVIYIEPTDLPRSVRGRPFWDCAEAIGRIIKKAGGDQLTVDSAMPAVGLGEDRLRSDASVPYLMVGALDALSIPSLTLGHPPKGAPEGEPFGSFAWVAAMRLTWLGTKAEGDGHRIRWRPRKRNERGHLPGVLLTIEYGDDGRPCGIIREDDEESTRDWLLAALVSGPRAVADMAEDMLADVESPTTGEVDRIKERLARALNRMRREGWVDRLGTTGRGVRWELRTRP